MTSVPPSPGDDDPNRLAPASGFGADELVAATGGRLLRRSDRPVRGGAVDSRRVAPGNLFAALPGEHADGHAFLVAAAAAGAAALLVRDAPDRATLDAIGDCTVVVVPEVLAALQAIAARWRDRFDPLVVGVTGSVGKTSTKEATAAVLAAAMPTLRNEGNLNNEVGLPLTLLRLEAGHRAAVLEMGMYVGGEIALLAGLARPSIGIVTRVAPVHLSRAGSIEAIERAKAELVEALPADGTAILNADDPRVRAFGSRTRARSITFGLEADADVTARAIVARGEAGMDFEVVARAPRATRFRAAIPSLGRHSVSNALAAVATGLVAGLTDEQIAAGLAASVPEAAPHRGVVIHAGGVTILDDTYNASPPSMLAALEVLAGLPGRPVAVLGEMLELGDVHDEGHRSVGAAAARVVAELVVVGRGAAPLAEAARAAGLAPAAVHEAADRAAAIGVLRRIVGPGDVILVKASRGAALEVVVEALVEATTPAPAGQGGPQPSLEPGVDP